MTIDKKKNKLTKNKIAKIIYCHYKRDPIEFPKFQIKCL